MRYPPSLLDEIRARLPVSVVVGRKVALKRAGREFKGLSPFNAERSPSFFVNDQKGFYHCFSSGQHGDVFTFLMETEGVSFPEAVERLAGEAGVSLPTSTPEAAAQDKKRRTLGEALEIAAGFFEEQLRGRAGAEARAYLERRDIDAGSLKAFRVGYAPADRYALRDHLAGKDVPSEVMIEAGLLVTGEDVKVPYDRFRERVMFPISDARGRVIAFGGRALRADVPAKYLNSPETPLFRKGEVLYNHHAARKAAHDAGAVVAVEGYLDVVAMTRAGIAHAVAPLGTALTEEQLGLLWRMADEPVLCLDGDGAGRRAAERAIDLALPLLAPGRSLRIAFLPAGQDPDDLLRASGAGAVKAVVEAARPLADVLWERERDRAPRDTPERRAAFEARARALVQGVRDEAVRRAYRDEFEARLRALRQEGRDQGRGGGGPGRPFTPNRPRRRGFPGDAPAPALEAAAESVGQLRPGSRALLTGSGAPTAGERELLAAALNHPALLEAHAEELAGLRFAHPALDRLARCLLAALGDQGAGAPDGAALRAAAARAGLAEAVAMLDAKAPAWARAGAAPEAAAEGWGRALALRRGLDALDEALAEAWEAFEREVSEDTQARYYALKAEREALLAAAHDDPDA